MHHPHLPQLCGKESDNGAQQGGDSNSRHCDKCRRYDNCRQTVDGPVEPYAQCSRYEQTISCGGRETNRYNMKEGATNGRGFSAYSVNAWRQLHGLLRPLRSNPQLHRTRRWCCLYTCPLKSSWARDRERGKEWEGRQNDAANRVISTI